MKATTCDVSRPMMPARRGLRSAGRGAATTRDSVSTRGEKSHARVGPPAAKPGRMLAGQVMPIIITRQQPQAYNLFVVFLRKFDSQQVASTHNHLYHQMWPTRFSSFRCSENMGSAIGGSLLPWQDLVDRRVGVN